MFTVLVVLQVFVAAALILVVLLQSSKGEALAGSAFGSGGGGGSFGRTRGSFLARVTTVLASLFMVMCIVLALFSSGRRPAPGEIDTDARSVVSEQMKREMENQPPAAATQPVDTTTGTVNLDSLTGSTGSVKIDTGARGK